MRVHGVRADVDAADADREPQEGSTDTAIPDAPISGAREGACPRDPALRPVEPEGIPMHCPRCGFENPEGLKFCNDCGAPLRLPQAEAALARVEGR
jgi:hypothetical protein